MTTRVSPPPAGSVHLKVTAPERSTTPHERCIVGTRTGRPSDPTAVVVAFLLSSDRAPIERDERGHLPSPSLQRSPRESSAAFGHDDPRLAAARGSEHARVTVPRLDDAGNYRILVYIKSLSGATCCSNTLHAAKRGPISRLISSMNNNKSRKPPVTPAGRSRGPGAQTVES